MLPSVITIRSKSRERDSPVAAAEALDAGAFGCCVVGAPEVMPETDTPFESLTTVMRGSDISSSVMASFFESRARSDRVALNAPTESEDVVPAALRT